MAYQVMEVLMNYQRTVEDLKHCDARAKTGWWLPQSITGHLSGCVSSAFTGPCKDPFKTVPCGDHTCRSTYVECLRAIYDLEQKEAAKLAEEVVAAIATGGAGAGHKKIKSKLTIEDFFEEGR